MENSMKTVLQYRLSSLEDAGKKINWEIIWKLLLSLKVLYILQAPQKKSLLQEIRTPRQLGEEVVGEGNSKGKGEDAMGVSHHAWLL